MPSRKIEDLHPDLQPLCKQFIEMCFQAGVDVFLTTTFRSKLEQDALYAQGRSKPGKIVTNARGGQSHHNRSMENGTPASLAFDIALRGANGLNWDTRTPQWKKAVQIGRSLGLECGADWKMKDYPHFQLNPNVNKTNT